MACVVSKPLVPCVRDGESIGPEAQPALDQAPLRGMLFDDSARQNDAQIGCGDQRGDDQKARQLGGDVPSFALFCEKLIEWAAGKAFW